MQACPLNQERNAVFDVFSISIEQDRFQRQPFQHRFRADGDACRLPGDPAVGLVPFGGGRRGDQCARIPLQPQIERQRIAEALHMQAD